MSTGLERLPFYGGRVPPTLKLLCKALPKLEKKIFRAMLQLAVDTLEGTPISDDKFAKLASAGGDTESMGVCTTALTDLLRLALRLPLTSLKSEHFKLDLEALKVPAEMITDLQKVVFGDSRELLVEALGKQQARGATVKRDGRGAVGVRWRVDVGISTSALKRTMKPTVLMQFTLSDGRVELIEFSTERFHELRYSVAYVIREMETVLQKNILKIED